MQYTFSDFQYSKLSENEMCFIKNYIVACLALEIYTVQLHCGFRLFLGGISGIVKGRWRQILFSATQDLNLQNLKL